MSKILINRYLNDLDVLKKVSGSSRESVLREAFKDLLKDTARQNGLVFLAEHEYQTVLKTKVYPDGAVLHDIRIPLGYWEAKDEDDVLDEEVEKKRRKGYPFDNIVFSDDRTAILFQNNREITRCGVEDTDSLVDLLELFFGYERPEIADFRKAVEQFKVDLPAVLKALREKIEAASAANTDFRKAENKFLIHAKDTINPAVTAADVREMLIQHILTEEIFSKVFNDDQFHRENNVARELYALEGKFFTGATRRDTLKQLEPYYQAIRTAASQISGHHEKQNFLKVIYENFYKVYNPKAADRLGVVYTPNEIVKFMIEGADWLCEKHFGKNLIDPGVEILDPATGTGTYICALLEHFRGQKQKLFNKYKEELHANEVAILPYYVANLNIEMTYAQIAGQYAEFPNLCFVDTLDNVAGLGIRSGHQHDLFGALSEENVERIKRQNRRKISVILGNPPYNANQQNESDNNKNRTYQRIDERIKATYIKDSTAQKTKAYDMYTRFYRWASDRLHDDGILAFITNRSFIDSRTMDGFRKSVAKEFSEIYVVDLGGDVRANPKLSGTKNNVFGIQTGVAICFLVTRKKKKKEEHTCRIHYIRRPEMDTADEKLAWLSQSKLSQLEMVTVRPDAKTNWINLTENDWDTLIPIGSKDTKLSKLRSKELAIFKLYSLGVVTARDEWVYGFSNEEIRKKIQYFLQEFNNELTRSKEPWDRPKEDSIGVSKIKWTRALKASWKSRLALSEESGHIVGSDYRPFVRFEVFYSAKLNQMIYQTSQFCGPERAVPYIAPVSGGRLSFTVFAGDRLPNYALYSLDPAQCFPRFRYSKGGEIFDNITDWALKQFQQHYAKAKAQRLHAEEAGSAAVSKREGAVKKKGARKAASFETRLSGAPQDEGAGIAREITKDAIFHYVYGVLHDPVYREKYALNLKREFPRIPFYPDFWQWAEWGEALMKLHIGYENVDPWPLERIDTKDEKAAKTGARPKPVLKSDKDTGIIRLDTETQLTGVPKEAWTYVLGNRSALDWILDQHKEKTPKDPTIRSSTPIVSPITRKRSWTS
jgi:predicted helicase